MEHLNNFERSILEKLAEKYDFLASHIPFLSIKNRPYTGVGMYINFTYTKTLQRLPVDEISLGTNEVITVQGIKNGLVFELDISHGRINFLELVTMGEPWDGNAVNYSFV